MTVGTTGARHPRPLARRAAASLCATAMVLTAASCSDSSSSADSNVIKVELRSGSTAPALYYGIEQGIFEDLDLDVQVKVGEVATTSDLVAKKADIVGISLSAILGVANEGADARPIYTLDSAASSFIATASDEITSPEQCRTVTAGTPGTNNYAWAVTMQELFDTKWEISTFTDVPSMVGHVVSGQSDCGVAHYSLMETPVNEGKLRIIFDPSKIDERPAGWPTDTPENVFAGIESNLDAKRPAVEKFLKGYVESVAAYKAADPAEVAAALMESPDFAASNKDSLASTFTAVLPFVSPNDGMITEDTWAKGMAFFKGGGADFLDPSAEEWSFENRTDMSFLSAALDK